MTESGHHHVGGGHDHTVRPDADRRYLRAALALIACFMLAEAVVAFAVRSMALLADSAHMVTDAASLVGALAVIRLAGRPAGGAWTYGLSRSEVLSAAANGVGLLLAAVLISYEAIRRLVHPSVVGGTAVLVVALAGVAVNLGATWLLSRANRTSLNVEGAFQHILTDLYAFGATVVAGVVIVTTGYRRADPAASLVVVGLMLRAAWRLLRVSGAVLLQASPAHVDLAEVRRHILEVEHVLDVHDLHVWSLTPERPVLTAHVVVEDSCFMDHHAPRILDELQSCLGDHFDVEHSTFQLEAVGHTEHETGIHD